MLIEFSVENFLSIREKVTLSMVASSDKSNDNNLIINQKYSKDSYLKSAVIYGANASGKTNVLKAFEAVVKYIHLSNQMQPNMKIPVTSFKLDENYVNKPSKFDVIFIYDNIKYAYGFTADASNVYEEYLYYYPNGKEALIFERTNVSNYKFNEKDKKILDDLKEKNTENKLFLATATTWNFSKTRKVFEWFTSVLNVVIDHSLFFQYTVEKLNNDVMLRNIAKSFLKEADLGIQDFDIDALNVPSDEFLNNIPDPIMKRILEENIKSGATINSQILKVITYHKGLNKNNEPKNVLFELAEESLGTQKFFGIIGPWIDVLKEGKIIVIDEMDIRLHPHLVKYLVMLFHDPNINTKNAQLIFNTHDTNLLSLLIFRRDQVWFTEKNNEVGATDLYSLDEFPVRKEENIQKGYLQGRYGAIPFLGTGEVLWGE